MDYIDMITWLGGKKKNYNPPGARQVQTVTGLNSDRPYDNGSLNGDRPGGSWLNPGYGDEEERRRRQQEQPDPFGWHNTYGERMTGIGRSPFSASNPDTAANLAASNTWLDQNKQAQAEAQFAAEQAKQRSAAMQMASWLGGGKLMGGDYRAKDTAEQLAASKAAGTVPGATAGATPGTPGAATTGAPGATPGERMLTAGPPSPYTVQKGDTLSQVSEKYSQPGQPTYGPGGALVAAEAANPGLKDPNKIYPGQKLVMPGYGEPTAPAPAGAAPTTTPATDYAGRILSGEAAGPVDTLAPYRLGTGPGGTQVFGITGTPAPDTRTPAERAMGVEAGQGDFAARILGLQPEGRTFEQDLQLAQAKANADYQKAIDVANIGRQGKEYAADKGVEAAAARGKSKDGTDISKYINPNANAGLTGEAALSNYTPDVQKMAKNLAEAKIPWPGNFALKDPYWKAVIQAASDYTGEDLDAAKYKIRSDVRKSFTSGADAKNINSINTLVGHLNSLNKSAQDLNNGNFPWWNKVENFAISHTGDPRLTKFNMDVGAVESELASVFKNTGATDQEIKAWRERVNASDSPAQLQTAIKEATELMASRLAALHNKYQAGMGNTAQKLSILSPKSRQALTGMGIDVSQIEPPEEAASSNALPSIVQSGGQPIKIGRFSVEVQ